jgi:hypothetical protein
VRRIFDGDRNDFRDLSGWAYSFSTPFDLILSRRGFNDVHLLRFSDGKRAIARLGPCCIYASVSTHRCSLRGPFTTCPSGHPNKTPTEIELFFAGPTRMAETLSAVLAVTSTSPKKNIRPLHDRIPTRPSCSDDCVRIAVSCPRPYARDVRCSRVLLRLHRPS